MASLFQKVEKEAFKKGITLKSKESRKWFAKHLSKMGRVNRIQLLKDERIVKRVSRIKNSLEVVGQMYMYKYDPKYKKELPYYDRFPLVVIIEGTNNGFYGLNLHYLPILLRAKLLDGLMEITTNDKFDETTKFRTRYKFLNRNAKVKRYFEPCVKRYLFSQIQGKMSLVHPNDWEIATFLPTQQFRKTGEGRVWADSRQKLNG
tara:strand:- start:2758 stop:3369 length:612 start_codon:yes stop_codon:yes gene_type:complete